MYCLRIDLVYAFYTLFNHPKFRISDFSANLEYNYLYKKFMLIDSVF